MKIEELWLIIGFLKFCLIILSKAQINLPPRFVIGGDMAHFSIPENVEVGSTVYKLRGTDPEELSVYFSISGEHFSVNKYSGDITLIKKLDREVNDIIEVIISITDEAVGNAESNTISLRREIPIIDINDNLPLFGSPQYSFSVSEITKTGTVVFNNITISDNDFGLNAMVNLFCVQSLDCRSFSVSLQIISEGFYRGIITLAKPLNYESQSSYLLWLKAIDSNPKNPLSTTVKVIVDVEDIQDESPIFLNTPYSISLFENMLPDQKVLNISAKDGDVKNRRPILFSIEQDILKYFSVENHGNGNGSIVTTENPIDRENNLVVQMGGIYTFYVKATELINNELPGDETKELVTIVIMDQNDQSPKFNKPIFELNISEDITVGTPLPSFGMVVSDDDLGENSHFTLNLKSNDSKFANCFSVEPLTVIGRSPVIIRVINNSALDYENGVRKITLYVAALVTDKQKMPLEIANSIVILNIIDANDNFPEFMQTNFIVNVTENTTSGSRIADIIAHDRDSGLFSEITYAVGGFGMEKFDTDPKKGGLILSGKLDYEQQMSYSLTLEAKDGGNRTTTANILVNVIDVNDNTPIFEHSEYRRNIREGSENFQPQFFIKATDADGIENSNVTYTLVSSNSDAIDVDKFSGEIIMLKPASSHHTSRGQYELRIRANDSGTPSLFSHTHVFIRVGIPGNQRPVFKETPYNVTIPETLSTNSLITTVRATDPDGSDELIEYKITAGADNFYIKSRTGKIYLSENADLINREKFPKKFNITVLAIDNGVPLRETAQITVSINVLDVNNEPPAFRRDANYISHITEKTPVGSTVMNVKADDPDENSSIEYVLLRPFKITDRRGFLLKDEQGDYNQLFGINENNGDIILQHSLRNTLVHVIAVTVEARDRNAVVNIENQRDRVEITFFVETEDEMKPIFLIGGWMRSNPIIKHNMFEEMPIGYNVMTIRAHDPLSMKPVTKFEMKLIPRQLAVDPIGNVVVTERIDYETMSTKVLTFVVEAISNDFQRKSEAKVIISIMDVNDHTPQFQYKNYQGSVEENAKTGTVVLVVKATDGDLIFSPQGYGNISYSLTGEHAFLFNIDSVTGEIKVESNALIDREKLPALNLVAVATDTPAGGKNRKKTEVPIQIDVLDVNDNAPVFKEQKYSVVILENCQVNASVLNVTAFDPDIGLAGNVTYEIVNEFENFGLFKINEITGEIKVRKLLTGRGRNNPYILIVRGQDGGEPILFTDIEVNILIGDVVFNDGIPVFIRPTEEEVAFVSEDAPIGSFVFQVVGMDPDDPFTPEGQIQYSFLKDNSNEDAFNIDSKTGLITNAVKLNREIKEKYVLIILIKDGGIVPQQVTRVFQINVNDTDDNLPLFKRNLDEKPMLITIKEELPIGTIVGSLEAIDLDEGRNAEIGYLIIDGNEENFFTIEDSINNSALIAVSKRIDREKISHVLFTVKCFKKREKPKMLFKKYNKIDFSERQIYIKILDIDDNVPEFMENNITVGIRFNVPVDYLIYTLIATDTDIEADPVIYEIRNSSFASLKTKSEINIPVLPFILNNNTGELRTNSSIMEFVDGYFILKVSATNGVVSSSSIIDTIEVYVIRERGLLRFVFSKTPPEIKEYMMQFKTELKEALALSSMQLNVYETQFHTKQDGSLDFSKTSSCFQIFTDKYDLKEAELLFKNETNDRLKDVYQKYNVESVERCRNQLSKTDFTWVQISLLSIASFIGITSLISTCILCCSYSRWQRLR